MTGNDRVRSRPRGLGGWCGKATSKAPLTILCLLAPTEGVTRRARCRRLSRKVELSHPHENCREAMSGSLRSGTGRMMGKNVESRVMTNAAILRT
jgi:hypothetical protein